MKIAALLLTSLVAILVVMRVRPPSSAAAFVPVAASPAAAPSAVSAPSASANPLRSRAPIVVDVAGAVLHPGLVSLAPEARIDAAIRRAVPLAAADLTSVNLAAHAVDGEEIVVPHAGERAAGTALLPAEGSVAEPRSRSKHRRSRGHHARTKAKAAVPVSPVDLNRADSDELATVPGIGARLAERIVAFREANGPFSAIDDLGDVAGVSEHALGEMTPYLRIEP